MARRAGLLDAARGGAVRHTKRATDCFGRLVEMLPVDLGDLLQQLRGNSPVNRDLSIKKSTRRQRLCVDSALHERL